MGLRLTSLGVRVRRVRRVLPCSALAWLFSVFLVHGAVLRVLAAPRVLAKWANSHERAGWAVALGLSVGVMEDACVCVAVAISLWLLGSLSATGQRARLEVEGTVTSSRSSSSSLLPTATLVAIHFLFANAALCLDLVFVRTRHMRFTWDFVALAWRNRSDAVAQLQVDDAEWLVACEMGGATLLCTLLLWLQLDNRAAWRPYALAEWDLQLWRATASRVVDHWSHVGEVGSTGISPPSPTRLAKQLQHGDAETDDATTLLESAERASGSSPPLSPTTSSAVPRCRGFVGRLVRLVILWSTLVLTTLAMTKATPSLVAMLAWNASLCEPLRLATGVECMAARSTHLPKQLRHLLDTTTEHCAFVEDDADTLVRKTLGFSGPLAFDVAVQPHETPNVLVVVVESFRQRDSRYLVHPDHVDQFLPRNISLTPQFDHWAKRGIGFRSMWSSWRTSRSLEQILFGQLPLDSATDSGTTTGRSNVRLSGMPQLFQAKGYDTLFTTGSRLDYDEWDVFLSTHGFDKCLNGWDLAEIGQQELGIDWTRGDHIMAYWGIHDDLTFEVLGHELKKKQAAKKDTAKPWFAMHYTISSHVPFDERPDWFFRFRESDKMPSFSALYESLEDPEIRELVQNYAEMRYFTDLTLGSFLGDLERSGVLNDTIVIITGDHGHSPENGVAMPEEDQVGAMNVAAALIAEGRLGKYAGTVIDNVTAHYDWLNTIADIVGLPQDGFLQTGIGRSLKRKPLDADRVVYSHNPALNLAAVQGHTRMEFYADVPAVVRVFNIENDPQRVKDLRSDIPKARLREIERICDDARALNSYFTERWHADCLLPPHNCHQP